MRTSLGDKLNKLFWQSLKRRFAPLAAAPLVAGLLLAPLGSAQAVSPAGTVGSDRYETAVAINSAYFGNSAHDKVLLATGVDFPDALAGAALAGRDHIPLFVTKKTCMPKGAAAGVKEMQAGRLIVLGGTGAVSSQAAQGSVCQPPKKPAPAKPKPKPTPPSNKPPAGARVVTAGAFCKVKEQGHVGYTTTGKKMVCKKANASERVPRWRQA